MTRAMPAIHRRGLHSVHHNYRRSHDNNSLVSEPLAPVPLHEEHTRFVVGQ